MADLRQSAPDRSPYQGLGLSTRTQVSGHQFVGRRTSSALTRWQVRMEFEPSRRQSMSVVASVSAAVVLCLAALLFSFASPMGRVGDSSIVADPESGALYVRVGTVLYPALNLASARLIAGQPDNPRPVRASQLAKEPHGPMVGIPGAPSVFAPAAPATSSWLICDSATPAAGSVAPAPVSVTVIDGAPDLSDRRRVMTETDALVLRYGDEAWLIRNGRRSRVDPAERAVLLPLGLSPENVRNAPPMSQALFDVIPVGNDLSVPIVPGAGAPANFPNAPGPVGTVFATPQISGPQQYSVVLADGVQTISAVVAQILQNSGGQAAEVSPSALSSMPVVDGVDLADYPAGPLNLIAAQDNPVTCWWWQRTGGESRARTQLVTGPTLPVRQDQRNAVIALVKADRSGRQADQVYFGPDYANFVSATGNGAAAATVDSLWWVSESGVRFGVDGDEARSALGLTVTPNPAPWAALRLLPGGPALSRADALVRHDTLPTDLSPAELVVPK